jgi:hypothetical protein
MKMHIVDRGLVYDASGRPRAERIACFTSLCITTAGPTLAGFQVGPAKHAPTATVRLCRSHDAGKTWQELPAGLSTSLAGIPGSLAAGELVEVEPGRLLLFATWFDRSDPARPLFDPVTEGILHAKQVYTFSRDYGDSWSPWNVLPTAGLTGCATTGPVVQWPDGTIAYAFESFKEYDDPKPGLHAAWIKVSRDHGWTFSEPIQVAQHPDHKIFYWDQRLCPGREPGEFIALFWTHDLEQKKDLTVHLRRATLRNNRVEGPPVQATSMPGQIAAPLLLPDGRLLAFVVDRSRPGTLKLWQSDDGGVTWPEPDCLVVHTHDERAALTQGLENVDFKQYWEDMGKWSFGHPAIRLLDEKHVLLAHYAGTPDCMSVHWARVLVG